MGNIVVPFQAVKALGLLVQMEAVADHAWAPSMAGLLPTGSEVKTNIVTACVQHHWLSACLLAFNSFWLLAVEPASLLLVGWSYSFLCVSVPVSDCATVEMWSLWFVWGVLLKLETGPFSNINGSLYHPLSISLFGWGAGLDHTLLLREAWTCLVNWAIFKISVAVLILSVNFY